MRWMTWTLTRTVPDVSVLILVVQVIRLAFVHYPAVGRSESPPRFPRLSDRQFGTPGWSLESGLRTFLYIGGQSTRSPRLLHTTGSAPGTMSNGAGRLPPAHRQRRVSSSVLRLAWSQSSVCRVQHQRRSSCALEDRLPWPPVETSRPVSQAQVPVRHRVVAGEVSVDRPTRL